MRKAVLHWPPLHHKVSINNLMFLMLWIFLTCWSYCEASRPNIVLILADDLGFNDVPWHNKYVKAPNLMDLAKGGVILEQHYSQPSCSPTRSALLTARYPFHTGMNTGPIHPCVPHGLPTEFTTLADDLRKSGYSTQIVGKWHLGFCNAKYLPTNRGFDHFYGYWNGGEDYFYHERDGQYDLRDDIKVAWEANGTYSTKLLQEKAAKIIAKHDQSKPFFLYLPLQSVHSPLQVPHEYIHMQHQSLKNYRRIFLGMVTAMDDAVGNVTQALKNANILDNTIIIFFSDNGGTKKYEGNNSPLRGQKFEVFEGGTRTVAFIHGPGLAPRKETRMMHAVDWYPTIMAAVQGKPSQDGLDGVDLWDPIRTGMGVWKRNEIVYNIRRKHSSEDYSYSNNPQSAIRMDDWKFIWVNYAQDRKNKVHRNLLFNLAKDPKEKHNVAKQHQNQVRKMKARLKHLATTMYHVATPPLDKKLVEKIKEGKQLFPSGAWETGWC